MINNIEGYNNIDEFNIAEIKSEKELKNYIDDNKYKNMYEEQMNKIILVHFEQYDLNKIQYKWLYSKLLQRWWL